MINDLNTRLLTTIIGLLILTGLVFLSACDLVPPEATLTPTFTPTQTETPTPTIDWFPATPTPTLPVLPSPTPQPTFEDTRTGIGERLVDDDFTNETLWEIRQSPAGNAAFGAQNLTLAIARSETSLISRSQHNLPEDFYLEITLQTSLCQPNDQTGILFWQLSEVDFYRLLIDCAGQIRLEVIQGGQTTVIQDWESGRRVQPGAPAANRLGVWVSRGLLHLYINDAFQFEQRIATNRSGGLGVFARTIAGIAMTVRFSDLQIYRVEAN